MTSACLRAISGCLLCACLAGPLAAQEVRIHARPTSVQVYLQRPGFADTLLGNVEETLPLPSADKVKLRLVLPGHPDQIVETGPGEYPVPPAPPLQLGAAPRPYWLLLLVPVAGALAARRKKTVTSVHVDDPHAIKVGGYTLGERLGQGATATVYRAVNASGRPVALKLMDPQLSVSSEHRKRLDREVKIYREARHPHLVSLLDFGQHQDMLFLVYELLEGDNLRQLPKAPWREAVTWIAQALEAVQVLHDLGVAHRDLKPENLFHCKDGTIKVVDLGVARSEGMTAATATGMVVGTPAYMAPEQVQGEFTVACDQYALGTVLYELLDGRTPFSEEDGMAQAMVRLELDAPPLNCLTLGVPSEVGVVVARMLEMEAKDRFPSAGEAARALRAILAARGGREGAG